MLIDAGYDAQYRGKWHLSKGADGGKPDASEIALYGFKGWRAPDAGEDTAPENFGGGFANHDKAYVQQAIEYLRQVKSRRAKGDHQPYCLVLSLVNPHDVLCYPKGFQYGYNKNFLNGPVKLPPTVLENLAKNHKPMAQVQTRISAGILLGPLHDRQMKLNYINFYANMLRWVDTEIGFFLKELYEEAESGRLADQAIVFRIADHGEMGMAHGGMRQKAFVAYEEAIRIPMVISNPKLFPENAAYKSTENLASLVDILPTIASVTGATPPDGLRGVNLTPMLEKDAPVQDAILFTFDDTKAGSSSKASVVKAANRIRCVRTANWKFTHYFDALGGYPDEFELYDLVNDPIELNNLAYEALYATTRAKMAALLNKLMKEKLLMNPDSSDEIAFGEWFVEQK
jgi:arylsulfatase A-like enzyme